MTSGNHLRIFGSFLSFEIAFCLIGYNFLLFCRQHELESAKYATSLAL